MATVDGQQDVLFDNRLRTVLNLHKRTASVRIFCHQMRSELQKGPTCGFAVLLMALHCSDEITLDQLVEMGKRFGITFNGELFSAEWICEFVEQQWPYKYQLQVIPFPSQKSIVRHLVSGKGSGQRCPTTVLVPYDCDKNFEPCNLQGIAAHWAIIIGFVIFDVVPQNGEQSQSSSLEINKFNEHDLVAMDFDDGCHLLYLITLQGKSRHPALWSYKSLKESNGQLNVPRPSGNFRLAPEGMAAIRGKCVLFGGSTGGK